MRAADDEEESGVGALMGEALRRSEENFRTIIERSPLAMCVSRPDHLVYVNRMLLEYLGYERQGEMLTPTLAELSDQLIHPEDRDRTGQAFKGLFARLDVDRPSGPAGVVRIDDVRLFRKCDGAMRFCDMHGVVVIQDGAPALVTYLHDQTARRMADERLRLADRMASLGTLATGVAHEINNPLAYVMASMDLLARQVQKSESVELSALAGPVEEVKLGLERIRRIVRGLKTFSRADEETIGPVDIVQVLDSCVEMARGHLHERASIVQSYANVPLAWGNAARLAQVFLNLLINAAQAFDGGRVEDHEIVLDVSVAEQRVVVEVRDNGVGIHAEHLPRIFDPFFTTKPVGVGTGLGLSICHGIVTALGGEIEVESESGKGTMVRVRLPIAGSRT
jgi:PAS domain S-box-containing protein